MKTVYKGQRILVLDLSKKILKELHQKDRFLCHYSLLCHNLGSPNKIADLAEAENWLVDALNLFTQNIEIKYNSNIFIIDQIIRNNLNNKIDCYFGIDDRPHKI